MTSWQQFINAVLLNSLWQGAAIAFLLAIALLLLRRSDARVRYALCCIAMLALVVLPVWTALDVPVGKSSGAGRTVQIGRFEPWIPVAWMAGVWAWSLRLMLDYWKTRRLIRTAVPSDRRVHEMMAGLTRKLRMSGSARVVTSASVEVPSVVGLLRPAILVPVSALAGLPVEQLEAVLAHELAHVRRWDHWVNFAQCCVEALLFYHPAAWWVSARIRDERELCCDDIAVQACGSAAAYARALTALEKLRVRLPDVALASTHGSLLARIRRLSGQQSGAAQAWAPVAVALACLAVLIPPPSTQAQEQSPVAPARPANQAVELGGQAQQAQPAMRAKAKATVPASGRPQDNRVKGSLDAVAYAQAERELNGRYGFVGVPEAPPDLDSQWRAVMYESGIEHGAHFYLRYRDGKSLDQSPDYLAMRGNVQEAEALRKKYLAAPTTEERMEIEAQLRASLEQVQKDSAVLREQRPPLPSRP